MGARAIVAALAAFIVAGPAWAESKVVEGDSAAPTLAELGWPDMTISIDVRKTSHVRKSPHRKAPPVGKIARGTRALLSGLARGSKRCPIWVEIDSRGWLCARRAKPSLLLPKGRRLPVLKRGAVVPGKYFDVREDGVASYKNADAVRASEVGEELSNKTMVRGYGPVSIDGVRYLRTNKGIVHPSDLRRMWPSDYGGVDLDAGPTRTWPLAFVHTGRRTRPAVVRGAPDSSAPVIERLAGRTLVEVSSDKGDWVELGKGRWIRRLNLRIMARQKPPKGVAPGERWIDVDLDEQTLVAYEGSEPVFATLVSTGRVLGKTPTGVHRVRAKAASLRMAEDARYDVGAVPWVTRFRDGLFLHAAYWHDGFGARRSHGCVNLSPKDARFVYEFTFPAVKHGWLEVESPLGRGTPIRIRNTADPTPDWYDYADENGGVPVAASP